MSWKPEVRVGGDDKWYDNEIRFETSWEAESYARDLGLRWTAVRDSRAAEVDEPVNAQWVNGKMIRQTKEKQ